MNFQNNQTVLDSLIITHFLIKLAMPVVSIFSKELILEIKSGRTIEKSQLINKNKGQVCQNHRNRTFGLQKHSIFDNARVEHLI